MQQRPSSLSSAFHKQSSRLSTFTKKLCRIGMSASLVAAGFGSGGCRAGADASATPVGLETQQTEQKLELLGTAQDGAPQFYRGELGRIAPSSMRGSVDQQAERAAAVLDSAARLFDLSADELRYVRGSSDERGDSHLRYQQTKDGIDVVGGDFVLHINRRGVVYAANATPGKTAGISGRARPTLTAAQAEQAASSFALANVTGERSASAQRVVYVTKRDRTVALAWEVVAAAEANAEGLPVRDLVYVDATNGSLIKRLAKIHTVRDRKVHDARNSQSLPGTLILTETTGTTTDASVRAAFDNSGATWDFYNTFYGRDSIDNAGMTMSSTVHYGTRYNNAFWNGTQMVYGDGDGSVLGPLALSIDVAAHEMTHGVTEHTAGLEYWSESGGLNEAMSDIMGNSVEAWKQGAVSANTWKVGEDVWTPNTPGDALRYMNDPALDGDSIDHYNDYSEGVDVHYSSGLPNLAFYLLSQGGKHPRGKTSNEVPAIGIEKAHRIFYRALANYMTSTTTFAEARTATVQAATDLFDQATATAVGEAWAAVGVAAGGGGTGGGTGGDPIALTKDVPQAVQGAKNSKSFFTIEVPEGATNLTFKMSGGSGDADLYVRFNAAPTTSTYDYRSWESSNNENIATTQATAGTWWVLVNGYSAYSGANLVASYVGGGPVYPELKDEVAVTNLSGELDSEKFYRIEVPAGASLLTVTQGGGTGNSDLYLRHGDLPSTTVFDHSNLGGTNHEQIRVAQPKTGTYYLLVRGTAAYSGVTITARY